MQPSDAGISVTPRDDGNKREKERGQKRAYLGDDTAGTPSPDDTFQEIKQLEAEYLVGREARQALLAKLREDDEKLRIRAKERRIRAEERRIRAEERRIRAEERRIRDEELKIRAEERRVYMEELEERSVAIQELKELFDTLKRGIHSLNMATMALTGHRLPRPMRGAHGRSDL